jgi:hypothetical protein
MRIVITFIIFGIIILGCSPKPSHKQESVNQYGSPSIVFEKEIHDFGTIREGEEVGTEFWFKNSGDAPLVISNVVAGCGCTTAYWPQQPVLPDQSDKIVVLFNSQGREGKQVKTIRILSNAPQSEYELMIATFVKSEK